MKTLTLTTAALLLAAAGPASATVWTNTTGDGLWATGGNWDAGQPTLFGDSTTYVANINIDGTSVLLDQTGEQAREIQLGATGAGATLNVAGGDLNMRFGGSNSFNVGTGNGTTGTVNQTAGAVALGSANNGRRLNVGANTGAATGTYNLSGSGSVAVIGDVNIGTGTGTTGLFTITDQASLSVSGTTQGGVGALNLSRGSGDATLRIEGGDATIAVNDFTMTSFQSVPGSGSADLQLLFTDTGISTINVANEANLGFNTATLSVDTTAGFSASVNDSFLVLDAANGFSGDRPFGNLDDGDTIVAGDYTFQADYLFTATNDSLSLTVVAVPEPGTLALAGLGALALLRRNRG